MTYEQVDKLIEGQKYEFLALEDNKKMKNVENTYVGEFQGWDKWEDFVLFWIEGESSSRVYHYKDIITVNKSMKG